MSTAATDPLIGVSLPEVGLRPMRQVCLEDPSCGIEISAGVASESRR
ncbi:hypothetical protein OAL35_02010 [bacterium]|nr:hypothetical protein [bacterium]